MSNKSKWKYPCIFLAVIIGSVLLGSSMYLVSMKTNGRTDDLKTDNLKTDLDSTHDFVVTDNSPYNKSAWGKYRYMSVSSDAKPCSTIGVHIMARKGGSAVDAAIATMICIGVVNWQSSGIGGGHFMTIYQAPNNGSTEKVFNTILARERAPLTAHRDMYINSTDDSLIGGLSVGVPGEVKGFYRAWQKFGHIEWAELFKPTMKLCSTGYPISRYTANAIINKEDKIKSDDMLKELFVKPDGSLMKEGDIIKRPKMAITLQSIADDPHSFYNRNSQLANDIVADLQEKGGIITLDDLEQYEVYDKSPLQIHLDNGHYHVYSPRPPASGVVLQYILGILDGYRLSSVDYSSTSNKILTYHRMAEAFKFAYAKRSELGDEDFIPGIKQLLLNMTDPEFTASVKSKIKDTHTYNVSYYEPAFNTWQDGGTSHANILAPDGSAVAITSTINFHFGSMVRGRRTGIFFNNEMDDFSTPGTVNGFGVPASPSNYIEPKKMPMSSMCPTIITDMDGKVKFLTGASGGTRITTGTAFVTMLSLWLNVSVSEATDTLRIHHQLVPDVILTDPGFDKEIARGLKQKGHKMEIGNGKSVVQSIYNTCSDDNAASDVTECVLGVSDGRKMGQPDGV